MGVHGLWRLIEPSGRPVPLETLENKVLAVDVSIWLHQAIKGFQDSKGAPLPNAHLLGIYHRVCKLLYFKIKPVFVFDGGVPALKKQTIAKRNEQKSKNLSEANRIQKQILNTLLKHTAVAKVLSEKTKADLKAPTKSPTKNSKNEDDDLFKLPSSQNDDTTMSSEEEDSSFTSGSSVSPSKHWDLHTINEKSKEFKSLPADVRHEILTELKDTRKQSSWGRIHELPTQSDDFSGYQMKRLLKRYSVQASLEDAEKEMGGHSLSLAELESLLSDHGVITNESVGKRIASDENTRYLYVKDVKKQLAKAQQLQLENINEEVDSKQLHAENNQEGFKDNNQDKNQEQNDQIKETSLKIKETDQEIKETDQEIKEMDQQIKEIDQEENEFQKDIDLAIELSRNKEETKATSENIGDKEFQDDLELAIQLSLQSQPSTSETGQASRSYLENFKDSDFESSSSDTEPMPKNHAEIFSAAKSYMMEYSGLTPAGIEQIIKTTNTKKDTAVKNTAEILTTKKSAVDLISDSDSSDFLEVSDCEMNAEKIEDVEPGIEIVFQPKADLEDDIFEDIFNDEVNEIEPIKIKIKPTETPKKIEPINMEIKPTETLNKIESIETPKEIEPTETSEPIEIEDDKIEAVPIRSVIDEMVQKLGNKVPNDNQRISADQLKTIEVNLQNEKRELIVERSNKERLAGNITDQMYQEAQELLQLFGVPYIVAPMEAEAQCAFLNEINLTDGTITDDSDIWLFGGKTVYKNFFNQSKHVLEYRLENIENNFKLSRQQLILLALLVGSDYTIGIQGVGPVTALEILAAFPPTKINEISIPAFTSGLTEFRNWYHKGKVAGPGRATLRTKLKNVAFHDNFPNLNVIRAYLEPQIDNSNEKFSWGRPDIQTLTDYAKIKFGWSVKKSEEILKPVIKRLEETKTQSKIKDYFKTKHKLEVMDLNDKMSKRVKKAVGKIGKGGLDASSDEDIKVLKQTKKTSKRKVKAIEESVKQEIELKKTVKVDLHKKEYIPQKLITKTNFVKNKMKAIEVFRKSAQGPGYVKKRKKIVRKPKEDAELSESSSD